MVAMVSSLRLTIMGDGQECALDLSRSNCAVEANLTKEVVVSRDSPLDLSSKLSGSTSPDNIISDHRYRFLKHERKHSSSGKCSWDPAIDKDGLVPLEKLVPKPLSHKQCQCERERDVNCLCGGKQRAFPRWLIAPADVKQDILTPAKMDPTHIGSAYHAHHSINLHSPSFPRDCSSLPSMNNLSSCQCPDNDIYGASLPPTGYPGLVKDPRPQSTPEIWHFPSWDNAYHQDGGLYNSRSQVVSPPAQMQPRLTDCNSCDCSRKRKISDGQLTPYSPYGVEQLNHCFEHVNNNNMSPGGDYYLSSSCNHLNGSVVITSLQNAMPPPHKVRRDSGPKPSPIAKIGHGITPMKRSTNSFNSVVPNRQVESDSRFTTHEGGAGSTIQSKLTLQQNRQSSGRFPGRQQKSISFAKKSHSDSNYRTLDTKLQLQPRTPEITPVKLRLQDIAQTPSYSLEFPDGTPSRCVTVNSVGLCGGSVTVDQSLTPDVKPILDFINPL